MLRESRQLLSGYLLFSAGGRVSGKVEIQTPSGGAAGFKQVADVGSGKALTAKEFRRRPGNLFSGQFPFGCHGISLLRINVPFGCF
jgi:hypothetical protein